MTKYILIKTTLCSFHISYFITILNIGFKMSIKTHLKINTFKIIFIYFSFITLKT